MPQVTVRGRGVAFGMEAAGASFCFCFYFLIPWFKICVWDLLWVIWAGASQHLILLSFAVALGVASSSDSRLGCEGFCVGLF